MHVWVSRSCMLQARSDGHFIARLLQSTESLLSEISAEDAARVASQAETCQRVRHVVAENESRRSIIIKVSALSQESRNTLSRVQVHKPLTKRMTALVVLRCLLGYFNANFRGFRFL